MFENRALRRISRLKGKEVPEGRKTLKNEAFLNICCLANSLHQKEGEGHISSTSGLHKNFIQRLVGKPQEKKPFQ